MSETSMESSVKQARQALSQLYRDAEQRRNRALAARGGRTVAESYAVAVVPQHRARLRRLAAFRRRAFVARLRELIRRVRTTSAAEDETTLEHPAPLAPLATAVVAATCSACRGKCCGNGGDHAFLRTRTIREFMRTHPALSDDQIVHAYAAFLPVQSMHPGCVFQGPTGCALPRDMRSAICNAYLCHGLQQALDTVERLAHAGVSPGGVYVARRDGGSIVGGRLRTLPLLAGDRLVDGD